MVESNRAINEIGVERLRELVLEQQEVIEILRQTVKVDMQVERLRTATFDFPLISRETGCSECRSLIVVSKDYLDSCFPSKLIIQFYEHTILFIYNGNVSESSVNVTFAQHEKQRSKIAAELNQRVSQRWLGL